jgi:hypothetical protein
MIRCMKKIYNWKYVDDEVKRLRKRKPVVRDVDDFSSTQCESQHFTMGHSQPGTTDLSPLVFAIDTAAISTI